MTWERIRALWRIATWVSVAIVCALSLLPSDKDVDVDFAEGAQHFVAYLVLGIAAAAAYPANRLGWAAALIVLGGSLEILQHLSPGRAPSWWDFASGAAGALLGVAIARACQGLMSGRSFAAGTRM